MLPIFPHLSCSHFTSYVGKAKCPVHLPPYLHFYIFHLVVSKNRVQQSRAVTAPVTFQLKSQDSYSVYFQTKLASSQNSLYIWKLWTIDSVKETISIYAKTHEQQENGWISLGKKILVWMWVHTKIWVNNFFSQALICNLRVQRVQILWTWYLVMLAILWNFYNSRYAL